MPHASSRGFRIAYETWGEGPPVLLQHGLLSGRTAWRENGIAPALAREFTVVTVDALGHGESDKPSDPRAYGRDARADDLAAVFDALGLERAHLVGYSMGGWIATGFAARHPGRLLSLAIGGWDPVRGRAAAAPAGMTLDFETVLAGFRARAPALTAWVTPEAIPGLRACWDALAELDGAEAALAACPAPVLLWAGRDDPCHDTVQALAGRLPGARFRAVPGDHMGAMTAHARRRSLTTALKEFPVDSCFSRRRPAASLEALQEFLRRSS